MENNEETKADDGVFLDAREGPETDLVLQLPTQQDTNGDLPSAVSNVAKKFALTARLGTQTMTVMSLSQFG